MSFRRRENGNVPSRTLPKGVKPSAANGIPVTSSGCQSLDTTLSGHGGIPVGSGLLIGENGTTDFGGVLLRYFAAEGLLQEHTVWVGGGYDRSWAQELPVAVDASQEDQAAVQKLEERMKIAWRYTSLPEFGASQRIPTTGPSSEGIKDIFCHSYDLTKHLTSSDRVNFSPACATTGDPFLPLLASLVETLRATKGIVRAILPGLLHPLFYPVNASQSRYIIKFVNNLRAILRAHPDRLGLMATIPLDLYPRNSSVTAWMEILLDGVLELIPVHNLSPEKDGPQGLLKIHKVPMLEQIGIETDLSFKVTRKRFTIEVWSLPALAEAEPREGGGTLKNVASTNVDVSF